ncbi:Acetylglutamate kinase [Bienertia sinuspersici]
MADQEEEELQMALKMSMQPSNSPPEPKRSKPRDSANITTSAASIDGAPASEEPPELKSRRLQRELMAAAAEKRMMANAPIASAMEDVSVSKVGSGSSTIIDTECGGGSVSNSETESVVKKGEDLGVELSVDEANQLFFMVFGGSVTKEVIAQWTNQGIR